MRAFSRAKSYPKLRLVIDWIAPFAPCFYGTTTWMKAQGLLIGTILTPGKRVVTEALRVMGLSQSTMFAQYQHVLNRAVWSPLALGQVLLKLLLESFMPPQAALVLGIDPTIERRWGRKIAAFTGRRCAAATVILSKPVACVGLV